MSFLASKHAIPASLVRGSKECVPSIAQLEERGTVKETLCDPKVTGSTPVRRTFCYVEAAILRGDDAPTI